MPNQTTASGAQGTPTIILVHGAFADPSGFVARRMNAATDSEDGTHAAFIARPDVAAGLILQAVSMS